MATGPAADHLRLVKVDPAKLAEHENTTRRLAELELTPAKVELELVRGDPTGHNHDRHRAPPRPKGLDRPRRRSGGRLSVLHAGTRTMRR